MHSSNKVYTLVEYEGIIRSEVVHPYYQAMKGTTYDALKSFIIANNNNPKTNNLEIFSIGFKRGVGEVITARNFVGMIALKDGTVIEILPKVHDALGRDIEKSKRVFLDMLRYLDDNLFRDFNVSSLKSGKMHLFEVFISMFTKEVTNLIKQGLRSLYITIESNENFVKGKINHTQNIKSNLVHRERFALQFDDFNLNRAENRLIKSTLKHLLGYTQSDLNRQAIRRLLAVFADIPYSDKYDEDFKLCHDNRILTHYKKSLSWSRVFLKGNSFTSYSGSEVAIAILFPMEEVFEKYIGKTIQKLFHKSVEVDLQQRQYCLFDLPKKTFYLQPDIVLSKLEKCVVLDTKWKILDPQAIHYGISQADMYQMYAYGKKYNSSCVILIYPLSEGFDNSDIFYDSKDGVKVYVKFIDLSSSYESFDDLRSMLDSIL